MIQYTPKGVCATKVEFELKEGKVTQVCFTGGCNGNAQGIGKLVEGMEASEVIKRLEGTCCGNKNTSCPDQLAKALAQHIKQ